MAPGACLSGRERGLLAKAAPQEAQVIDLAQDGRGVAKAAGKTVFIDGALPGESVRFTVYKRRRQFDEAGLDEILSASPQRIEPGCRHFGVCGGCSLQHLEPGAQLRAKQTQLLDAFEHIGGVVPDRVLEPLQGAPWAYRRRARLGIKYVHKKGRVLAGFRERRKPYVADIQRCEILVRPHAELAGELAALAESLSIRDRMPQVEVAAGDEHTALVLRVMEAPSAADLTKIRDFGTAKGVQIFLQSGGLDSVRPLEEGYPPLSYAIDGGRVHIEFGPVDFIQVNREVNVSMVDAALKLLEPRPEDTLLDLFCGLGNFTLPLARRSRRALGVEGDPGLVAKARSNAARNAIGNAEFIAENLFDPAKFGAWSNEFYDLVLLDPPRAGAVELLPCIARWQPRRVVYISCHPGSLARDAGILVRDLGFTLTDAGVMDMFPQTTHVESIAVFERCA
jgi:23S rRNA (uracil1939-C5)-methyltransferase